MYTLYGKEAKDGDYVLVQDVAYMKGSADVRIAQVRGKKAYAAGTVSSSNGVRWLRKEIALAIFPEEDVPDIAKQLIQMNMEANKGTIECGTDYLGQVMQLQAQLHAIDYTRRANM